MATLVIEASLTFFIMSDAIFSLVLKYCKELFVTLFRIPREVILIANENFPIWKKSQYMKIFVYGFVWKSTKQLRSVSKQRICFWNIAFSRSYCIICINFVGSRAWSMRDLIKTNIGHKKWLSRLFTCGRCLQTSLSAFYPWLVPPNFFVLGVVLLN